MHEAARREKLRKFEQLGIDPWGHRFDDHTADRHDPRPRRRDHQSKHPPAGERARGPDPARPEGARRRPHRAACAKTGKLLFVDIRDMTGQIQLFIGQKQVGDDNWAAGRVLRPGRHHRRRRRAAPHEDRRAVDLRRAAALPDQVARSRRPRSTTACTDPELRQRHAVSRPDLQRRRARPRFSNRTQDRRSRSATRSPTAASSKSKGRRCTRSPAAPRPGRSRRITTRSTSTCSCGSRWSCI